MIKGLLHFHQGWTDIVNCLPLIDFYLDKGYDLTVISRHYAKDIVEHYIRGKANVKIVYALTDDTDSLATALANTGEYRLLFHGFHDSFRRLDDEKRGAFGSAFRPSAGSHFVKLFYEVYDIPYMQRVIDFNIVRDYSLEDIEYNRFVETHGDSYILYHGDIKSRNIIITSNLYNSVNLNGITNNVFSFIKVLENAKELHLIDSIWASFCYLLNAKYGLLKDKTIYLYPFLDRSGGCVATKNEKVLEPLHLDNWIIIN